MTWLVLGMIGWNLVATWPPDAVSLTSQAANPAPEASADVPELALREIHRRGALVERIGLPGDDDVSTRLAQALAPPPDDSHKWFITLIVARDCPACDQMRADFEQAPSLAAWVDPHNPQRSWAHWQVFQTEDASQPWRWHELTLTELPAVIVQPPLNRTWGDPHTVVYLRQGYLPPDQLSDGIRRAIQRYIAKLPALHTATSRELNQTPPTSPPTLALAQAASSPHATHSPANPHDVPLDTAPLPEEDAQHDAQQHSGDWKPPVAPPPRLEPAKLLPNLPPEPAPGLAMLLVQLLTALLSGQGTSNALLLAILLWQVYRHVAKARGIPLLLSDELASQLLAALRAAPPADTPQPLTPPQPSVRA